jgi:ureidoglycolate lyase
VEIQTQPLGIDAFAPFGEVLQAAGNTVKHINRGMCTRYHDIANLDFSDGRAGISIFDAKAYTLPLTLEMVERHPEGSQAFLPLNDRPFLVVVATDQNGIPSDPQAFVTSAGQGVNYHRGTWHGVLTPLDENAVFAVVDRIGDGSNLQEYWFDTPFMIVS